MQLDLFIKTYHADRKWLYYCLQSICKYVTGFSRLNVVSDIVQIHNPLTIWTVFYYEQDKYPGYLGQQDRKLHAHEYSNADFIMYLDADCLFTHPINVQDLIKDGKPTLLTTPWESVGEAICWKKPTQDVFGEEPPFEGMRRNFLIYHRSTIEGFKNWFEKMHGINLSQYVMSRETLSEFNLLTYYAWKFERDKYNWIDTSKQEIPPETGRQFWSHSGLDEKDLAEIKKILE